MSFVRRVFCCSDCCRHHRAPAPKSHSDTDVRTSNAAADALKPPHGDGGLPPTGSGSDSLRHRRVSGGSGDSDGEKAGATGGSVKQRVAALDLLALQSGDGEHKD